MNRHTALSRKVARALRHTPWLYELELDEAGWTSVDALVEALRRDRRWRDVTAHDLEAMLAASAKQRYEIACGRIRALYGHSIPGRVTVETRLPPTLLFHGTAPSTASAVLADGLRPMGRQYVHLSVDVETARAVGSRKAGRPVVLQVSAEQAARGGVAFYVGNDQVWLADVVPARYIRPLER